MLSRRGCAGCRKIRGFEAMPWQTGRAYTCRCRARHSGVLAVGRPRDYGLASVELTALPGRFALSYSHAAIALEV